MTVEDILIQSSNIGTVKIAKKEFENEKLPLWKRILALFKIAFTAVGKQD